MVRHGDVELGGSCLASCYGCTEEHGDHRDGGEPEAVRLRDLDDEAAHEASEGSGEHQTGDGPLDMVRHGDVELGGSCLASFYGCRLHA